MVIMHNMAAINAQRQVVTGEKKTEKSTERLSSGYRINRAADDAAGLTVSEKMRWQIRGLGRAADNSRNGISYIQTAEGALQEMHSMLDRMKELSVQAANDTNTTADRQAVQAELDQLSTEMNRISSTTQYNTLPVFSENGMSPYGMESGAGLISSVRVSYEFIDADGNILTPSSGYEGTATGYTGDQETMARYIAAEASKAASAILNAFPALLSGSSPDLKIGLNLAPMDGVSGTLASASLSMSYTSSQTEMTYTMNVDTADYDITNYNDGSLSATLSHEMTHLIMQDVLTSGMVGTNSEPYPLWFVEGMAQTASGDDGWLSGTLTSASSDSDIQNYLAQTASMPYGAGYLSTLYLAQMASGAGYGAGAVTTSSLQSGINTILGNLVQGKTLSQTISEISGGTYSSYSAFAAQVSGDTNALDFTRSLLAARGTNGAGSVIAADLTTETADILNGQGAYTTSYTIVTGTSAYTNVFGNGFTFPDSGAAGGTGGGGTGTAGTTNTDSGLHIQVGALGGQAVLLHTFDASTDALFQGNTLDVTSYATASEAMDTVESAIDAVSRMRSYYGAVQNRLEHTIANVENIEENTQGAESRIRDTDMAEEMVSYSSAQIITQAAQSMLAQANQSSQGVLQLLEG